MKREGENLKVHILWPEAVQLTGKQTHSILTQTSTGKIVHIHLHGHNTGHKHMHTHACTRQHAQSDAAHFIGSAEDVSLCYSIY